MSDLLLAIVMPDIRSAQNVGAILRTANAANVSLTITCGYTPHPPTPDDPRPPHVIMANTRAIAKTALGSEHTIPLLHFEELSEAFKYLRQNHYKIAALEQAEDATNLFKFQPTEPLALILGNEVTGLNQTTLTACDHILELPMLGTKESLNVAVAAGIALYQLRFGACSSDPSEGVL